MILTVQGTRIFDTKLIRLIDAFRVERRRVHAREKRAARDCTKQCVYQFICDIILMLYSWSTHVL